MWIGSSKQKNTNIMEFSIIKDPIKIPGAQLYNANRNNNVNFFRKMKTKLNF